MNAIQFLAEWALRSSILIVSGALLLQAFRVKDASVRSAAWTAMLFASLALPLVTATLPKLPLAIMPRAPARVEAPPAVVDEAVDPVPAAPTPDVEINRPIPRHTAPTVATPPPDVHVETHAASVSKPFDWARAALVLYVVVALALLLRLCFGLAISLRLLRRSRATGQATEGIEIRESDRIASPVTLGILRPAIVLPADWRQWNRAQMDAVVAHERSHIQRHDPALQLLSAIHRIVLWHSPLSWFLHRQIVRVAEELSDDAAVAATRDRTLYAEILLDFIRRGVWRANWQGVPVARYGGVEKRIHRILDGTALSLRVTRWGLAAILISGLPLAYVAATAHPQPTPPAPTTAVQPAGTPTAFGAPAVTTGVAGGQEKIMGIVMPKAAPIQPTESPLPSVAAAPDGAMSSGPAFYDGVFVTPVPDAPFSANAEQDMEQVLNDGSAFHRKTAVLIARDSQGRIHNESREILPASSTREPILNSIHIYDPATRLNTFLDPYTHVARQRILPNLPATEPPGNWWLAAASARTFAPALQVQDLGPDVMEGVDVHGYRRTYTVPANASGTDRPAIVSDEIWYSEQLHINVLTRHSNPRTGQLTLTVTNINVNEPDVELFAIPTNYKLVAGPSESFPVVPAPVNADTTDATLHFRSGTITPGNPNAYDRHIGTPRNRRFYVGDATLDAVLEYAYRIQLRQIVGGPDWMDKDKFNMAAVPDEPEQPTEDQWHIMVQRFLADRFKLSLHRETRRIPVYLLSVAADGPRLIKNQSDRELHPFIERDVPGGVMLHITNGTVRDFIDLMQRTAMDRPIVDQTEMADRYDFSLRWEPGNDQFTGSYHWTPSPSENPLPDLFTAMHDQLGLRLEPSEADVDVLVIDHVEKPLME